MIRKWKNTLFLGNNLSIMRNCLDNDSVDLIYLDPPFNSKTTYFYYDHKRKAKNNNTLKQPIEVFTDVWQCDDDFEKYCSEIINSSNPHLTKLFQFFTNFSPSSKFLAYLAMMAVRLVEMHRILNTNGSIYLHCDPSVSHYLKLLMDSVFGIENFQNEIIWSYKTGGVSSKRWGRKHDVILFYSKSQKFKYNSIKEKSFVPSINFTSEDLEYVKRLGLQKENGLTYRMVLPRDVWEINSLFRNEKQRMGYPTQKPEALLERIVLASSNKGDILLDPFCGSGTSLAIAKRYERDWIGIDYSPMAIELCKKRLDHNQSHVY